MLVRKCKQGMLSLKCKAVSTTPGLEHYCFVAYAAVEVVGLHAALWYVSLLLLLTGAGAILWDKIKDE